MSRKRKPKHAPQIQREATPVVRGDIGTPELHQREVVVVNRGLARVVSVTTFDYYHFRGWIDDRQHDAAAELLRCAYVGGIIERGRSCLDERIPGQGAYSGSEAQARQRYRKGMDAVKDGDGKRLIEAVVIDNHGVNNAGRMLGIRRSGAPMIVLRECLDDIAKAYGIA